MNSQPPPLDTEGHILQCQYMWKIRSCKGRTLQSADQGPHEQRTGEPLPGSRLSLILRVRSSIPSTHRISEVLHTTIFRVSPHLLLSSKNVYCNYLVPIPPSHIGEIQLVVLVHRCLVKRSHC